MVALRQNKLILAAAHIKQALASAQQQNDKVYSSVWASYAGQIDLAQNQLEEARAHVAQALLYARQCRFEPYLAIALVTTAHFHLASLPQTELVSMNLHVLKKAKRCLQRALSLSGIETETRIEALLAAARMATLENDREAAQAQAQTALGEAQRCGVEWLIPLARKLLS